jgi:hypothetical protein
LSWVKLIVGSAIAIGVVILLAGKKTVNGTVGIDESGVTVTPTDTNDSSQGTP